MIKSTSFHYALLLRELKYIEKTIFYGIYYNPKLKLVCQIILINYGNYQYYLTQIGLVTLKLENMFLVGKDF